MASTNINDIEKVLDDLDPSTFTARDAVHFRRIIAAHEAVARADRELHDAVREARARQGTPGSVLEWPWA